MVIKIAPSIDCSDYLNLQKDIEAIESGGADILHIDIMDGNFVPNFAAGPKLVSSVSNITNMAIDVHLQVNSPDRFIEMFSNAKADIITFHIEACNSPYRIIKKIKEAGGKACIAINPATPYSMIKYILPSLDMVLVMCIDPGFSGQTFIKEVIPKIAKIKEMVQKMNLNIDIGVDGNINKNTIKLTKEAGANVFILGTSSIFKQGANIKEQTQIFKKYCEEC